MKTFDNLFSKGASTKNISNFTAFSLNTIQMNAVRGGTQPITSDPVPPIIPPINDI